MSGETESNVSSWTVDSLHSHLRELMREADRRYEQRFVDQDKAVAAALSAADLARNKAEVAADKRFDSVNEFRATLADQTTKFIPRIEAEAAIARNTRDIQELTNRFNVEAGRGSGASSTWGYVVGGIGALATIIAVIVSLYHVTHP